MDNKSKITNSLSYKHIDKWFTYLIGFLFLIFILIAVKYQIKLLHYIEWGDESETIVTAKMIASGKTLYSEIFNHHGPLTFLFGFLMEKIGDFGVAVHRIPIAILQIIALFSIYFSPLLQNGTIRKTYIVAAFSIILLFLPEIFGHTYQYQVIAGLLLSIILAQYTFPSIICPEKLSSKQIFIGNILIASLPFLAITYDPITCALFFASLKKQYFKTALIALVIGVCLNILFGLYIGSIPGFLAFHLYLNLKILPAYGVQGGLTLIRIALLSLTESTAQFTVLIINVLAIARLSNSEHRFPWRSLLVGLGISSLLVRGSGFQGLPYFYSVLTIPLIFFSHITTINHQTQLFLSAFIFICIGRLSVAAFWQNKDFEAKRIIPQSSFSLLTQNFTDKNDKIIAYSFQNYEYILADRLPASGNFFYLPWQEKYNENPKLGIHIDTCKEISNYRPKIMLIDKWKVWGKYPWESYAECVQNLIDRDYTRVPDTPYYIRTDLIINDLKISLNNATAQMQPSTQLNATAPIKLLMTPVHKSQKMGLKRIGIMFGTYERKNTGTALLHLKTPENTVFTQKFSLSELNDNRYHFFPLDSKSYTEGDISSETGTGISTWENHDKKAASQTCIIYEYIDGKYGITPGCPLF